jgi:AraC-like DNA-binding protein
MRAHFEKVVSPVQQSFAYLRFKLPRFSSPYHFHPEFELTYIVHSRGRRFVGDHIAPFQEGDLVLLGSNLPHYWCNHAVQKSKRDAESIVLLFHENFLGDGFFNKPEMRSIDELLKTSTRGIQFSGKLKDQIAKRLHEMRLMDPFERMVEFLSILHKLSRAKDYKLLSSARFVPSLNQSQADRVSRAIQFVNENFPHEINQTDVARKACMSPAAFSRFFKKKTNRTFSEFVNEVRIGEACRMLIEEDDDVTRIAYACGFNNLSNFNRRFRDLKRCTPRELRKQYEGQGRIQK